jgi:hypothetical protein
VPEQHQQPRLHRRELQERLVYRHAQRAPDGALEERREHLRPVGERARELIVEHGQVRGGEDVPAHVVADQPLLGGGDPRLEHIALAEQLGAGVAHEQDVAGEQPVQHQEPEPTGLVVWDLPAAGLEAFHARDELCARVGDLCCRDPEP